MYFVGYRRGNKRVRNILRRLLAGKERSRRLWLLPLSLRYYPETRQRAVNALLYATRQPRSRLWRAVRFFVFCLQYNGVRRYFAKHRKPVTAVCWNGVKGERGLFLRAAKDAGAENLFLEEAPLSGRIAIDKKGINADNSVPREAIFYKQWAAEHDVLLDEDEWHAIRDNIRGRAPVRKIMQSEQPMDWKKKKYIFCPLQCPGDSQITIYGDWIASMKQFIEVLKAASKVLPSGYCLLLKEHPTSHVSLAKIIDPLIDERFMYESEIDSFSLVAGSEGVITLNSSVGLQTFFFDKPVITLGKSFYAFGDMAYKVDSLQALEQLLKVADDLYFDKQLRRMFISYLLKENFFPSEKAVLSGDYVI